MNKSSNGRTVVESNRSRIVVVTTALLSFKWAAVVCRQRRDAVFTAAGCTRTRRARCSSIERIACICSSSSAVIRQASSVHVGHSALVTASPPRARPTSQSTPRSNPAQTSTSWAYISLVIFFQLADRDIIPRGQDERIQDVREFSLQLQHDVHQIHQGKRASSRPDKH